MNASKDVAAASYSRQYLSLLGTGQQWPSPLRCNLISTNYSGQVPPVNEYLSQLHTGVHFVCRTINIRSGPVILRRPKICTVAFMVYGTLPLSFALRALGKIPIMYIRILDGL